jgi:glycosyltransferase involved in cell wall biosynthesis
MARACPVVASEVAGVAELLEPAAGRRVPPGNARMLVETLEGCYRRPDAARRLGLNAARRVQEEFSWSSVVEAYETIYDEVLGLASFAPQGGPALRGAR